MLDAWLNRTRDWLKSPEKLLALPEQEFVLWALSRGARSSSDPRRMANVAFLWGEPGSGINALLRQAWQPAKTDRRRSIVVANASEWSAWTAEYGPFRLATAVRGPVELLVCDHLEQLTDARGDGERLAAWLDVALAEQIPVIVTGDRLPAQIANVSPRLLSRLHGGLFAGVRPLSDESKQRLWNDWSTRATTRLPPQNLRTIDHRVAVTAGQLRRLWDAQHLAGRPQPTGKLVLVTLDSIAETVACDFDVTSAKLRSSVRAQQLQLPRRMAMLLSRELTSHSLATIGRYFGCRSHTAVTRCCTRLERLLADHPILRQRLLALRARLRHDMWTECG